MRHALITGMLGRHDCAGHSTSVATRLSWQHLKGMIVHMVRYTAFALLPLLGAVVSARAAEPPIPAAIAAPGGTPGARHARGGRASVRMQGRRRRQAKLGIPRTDRDTAGRRQDRRPSL